MVPDIGRESDQYGLHESVFREEAEKLSGTANRKIASAAIGNASDKKAFPAAQAICIFKRGEEHAGKLCVHEWSIRSEKPSGGICV